MAVANLGVHGNNPLAVRHVQYMLYHPKTNQYCLIFTRHNAFLNLGIYFVHHHAGKNHPDLIFGLYFPTLEAVNDCKWMFSDPQSKENKLIAS